MRRSAPASSRCVAYECRSVCGVTRLSIPAARGEPHGLPDHFRRDGRIGAPAMVRPGKEIGLRSHPAVVLAQRGEQRRTERDLAIATALALLDAEHHALAVDVADFQLARFAAAQAGAVERQQQRAVIEILRAGDQALDLLGTEHDRQAESPLRIRQVLVHVAPLAGRARQKNRSAADLGDHRAHGEPPLLQQIDLVASELGRGDPIEPRAGVLAKASTIWT